MVRNKGGSGGFFQGRRESWITGEFMARNKGGSGGGGGGGVSKEMKEV